MSKIANSVMSFLIMRCFWCHWCSSLKLRDSVIFNWVMWEIASNIMSFLILQCDGDYKDIVIWTSTRYGLNKCYQIVCFFYQFNKTIKHNVKAGTSYFAVIHIVCKINSPSQTISIIRVVIYVEENLCGTKIFMILESGFMVLHQCVLTSQCMDLFSAL